jgi:uncharacterized membrane protein
MVSAFIFAILSPIFYALMNIVDKLIITNKVKNVISYIPIIGIATLFYTSIFGLFLDWSGIQLTSFILPIIVGIIAGIQTYLYVTVLQKEDAANFTGLTYMYPIFVALLSYIFLKEIISMTGYVGMFLAIIGSIMLSVRLTKENMKNSFFKLIIFAISIAVIELLIKVITNNIPETNGMVITYVSYSITSLFFLFHKKTRQDFRYELKNLKWAAIAEFLTFLAALSLFFAMAGLPATIVASIAAIQPLFTLFFERIADKFIGKISVDRRILPKLIPICLIIIGVILIYSTQLS